MANNRKSHKSGISANTTRKRTGKKKTSTRKISKRSVGTNTSWKVVHIEGAPFERGVQHGRALYKELKRVLYVLPFVIAKQFNVSIDKYITICKKEVKAIIKSDFPEFYQEIEGISKGAKQMGVTMSVDQIIAWNCFLSMTEYFNNYESEPQRCSAFIATGNATTTGEIVMAHNTHCDLVSGSLYNIIMYVTPKEGFPFVMQTAAGFIASGTDFFITSNGIVGCETTISGLTYKPSFHQKYPYFCRLRHAMQYGKTLDDYERIMKEKNAGDYPCSWLFGDIYSNEIMLCEIGHNITSVKRTKNGIYFGMNSAIDETLRKKETDDDSYYDISQSSGARRKRLYNLLYRKHYGKLNVKVAQKILSDHYDVFDKRYSPSNLTVCNHYYEESNFSYPHAAQDGKVVDSSLAKQMKFLGIWGSSCGKSFSKKRYIEDNPSKKDWEPYLVDYPRGYWSVMP